METIKLVRTSLLAAFVARMDKLVSKAVKLNCESLVSYEVGGEVFKDTEDDVSKVSYTQVAVYGETPIIQGWQFLAVLEHKDGGTLVRTMSGDSTVPADYHKATPRCEHCNIDRYRKDTYLVQNTETKSIKQVGSSCLKDFTGHESPEQIAALFAEVAEMRGSEEYGETGCCNNPNRYDINFVVAMSIKLVRETGGYVSRANAGDESCSTSDRVYNDILAYRAAYKNMETELLKKFRPTEADLAKGKEMVAWAKEVNADNTYLNNLKVLANSVAISTRDFGLAASIVVAYNKAHETKVDTANSKYQGTVGKRQVFTGLTLIKKISVEGQYGTTNICRFTDAAGNVFVWFASNCGGKEFEENNTYTVKATVKAFKDYRGLQETVISRVVAA